MLPKMGFIGVNITIPHKEHALTIADKVSDNAALVGAVNTLIFRPNGMIYGENTDCYGFLKNLCEQAPQWNPKSGSALVLGAGGASRAVVTALSDAGVEEILVANRTRGRAERLREDYGRRVSVVEWARLGDNIMNVNLIVNATSLGMVGKPDLAFPFSRLKGRIVVADLVYVPLRTRFLEEANQHGCVTVDGLGMLLHQAIPVFERLFGKTPELTEEVKRAVLE